jgi:PilZ domain-containing protein
LQLQESGLPSPDQVAAQAAARSFTRSLNILLKYVRLYGAEHVRSVEQFETAWGDLTTAIETAGDSGLLIGASGETLLLDGVPVEGGSAEKSFAKLLDAAGIGSIQFRSGTVREDFASLSGAFAIAGNRPQALQESLRAALAESDHIRLNEIKFVAQDASTAGSSAAAQLVAASLGDKADQLRDILNDPHKLLQAIAAASTRSARTAEKDVPDFQATFGKPADSAQPEQRRLAEIIPFPSEAETVLPSEAPMTSDELTAAFRLLVQIGSASAPGGNVSAAEFPKTFEQVPATAQLWLHAAMTQLAASGKRPDTPLLLQLAEQLAIRFALERFERGEVRVNAVGEMLERMGHEMEALRTVLRSHEVQMDRAGVKHESHAEILDRQFWSAVPEAGKRNVLLSDDAWCIPPRHVTAFVEELIAKGEPDVAGRILIRYAQCVRLPESDARRKAIQGLSYLAELYGRSGGLLEVAIYQLGEQLAKERDAELQTLLSAAFVRLSQEAAGKRRYAGVQQALRSVDMLEGSMPNTASTLRPRIGVYERLEEFVDDALRNKQLPEDLIEVLQRVSGPAVDSLMRRFTGFSRRSQCDRAVDLARALGPGAQDFLRQRLENAPQQEAVLAVGLLSRLDREATDSALADRVQTWARAYQSQAVRQIASAYPEGASRLYLRLLDRVDRLVTPEVVDELGLSGDRDAAAALQQIAFAEIDVDSNFLRVKAVEALGRLRDPESAEGLRELVAHRSLLGWSYPRELRVAAAQALRRIEPDTADAFLADKGLHEKDLSTGALEVSRESPWVRQRRYPRFLMPNQVTATLTTPRASCRMNVRSLSLGGGAGAAESRFPMGTHAAVELQSGLRKLRAQVMLRELPTRELSFEIVRMDLQDRNRLRRLLSGTDFTASLLGNMRGSAIRRVS